MKSAARDRRRVDFFLFYLIGAVDANVLRFFEAIFAKKIRFFLRNDEKVGNLPLAASRKWENDAIIARDVGGFTPFSALVRLL